MAPPPKNYIYHFSHPGHQLCSVDIDGEFVCDGCKTRGTGKRYRCNGCDFDLHDWCATCPQLLSSIMHHHPLCLVAPKPHRTRICDLCRDPVEGLFYTCNDCEFDVHPLCTQLPEKLHHALHQLHPLILQSSEAPDFCPVCRNTCNGWRYTCGICNFGVHLDCVLAPVVPCQQHEQRVPFRPPPQSALYPTFSYGAGYPSHGPDFRNFGPVINAYHGGSHMYPQPNSGTVRLGTPMLSLVGQLGFGVISNMIFGVDVSSLLG